MADKSNIGRRPSSLTLSHIQEASKPSGYVNRQLSGHAKYVGNTFWALAGNHVSLNNYSVNLFEVTLTP